MGVRKRPVEQAVTRDRDIGRDQIKPRIQLINLFEHFRTLAGKRQDDHQIFTKSFDGLRERPDRKPGKAMAPDKFIAGKDTGSLNAKPRKLPQNFIRAIPHSI